jgi:ABC-type branched-subunit amino acid transport system ATPase component
MALIAKPKLLLMNEPSLGLGPLVVDELANTIATLCKEAKSALFS